MMSITESLTAALESSDTEVGPSFEDDTLLFEELSVTLLSIERDQDELHRLQDVYVGLESLSAMAGAIPRASVDHVALFQIAGNLATAGSDYGATHLFPSLEHSVGTTISNEQLTATIERLWQRIVELFKRLARTLAYFWSMIADASERLMWSAERMRRNAQASSGRMIKVPTITVRREIERLSIANVPPHHGSEIFRSLTLANGQLKVILNNYVSNAISTGESLIKSLSQVAPAPIYLENAMQASKVLRVPFIASALMAREYNDVRFAKNTVQAAAPLPGNKTLFVIDKSRQVASMPSLLSQAAASKLTGVRLLASGPRKSGPTENHEMATVPANIVLQIAQAIIDIVKEIQTFVKGPRKAQLMQTDKKLLNAAEIAKNKIYSNPVTHDESTHYEAAIRYTTAYTVWAQNPHDGLVTHLLSVCRAALVVGNKSLSQHR